MRRPTTAPPAPPLTEREREVLRLIAEGRTNAEIADILGIRFDTAKNHVHSILQKLDVATRDEAARWSRQHGREPSAPRRERARWARLALPVGLWRIVGLGALVAAGVGVAVVALGVLLAMLNDDDDQDRVDSEPTTIPATATAAPPSPTIDLADTPTPAPTPQRLIDGIPEGAVGPLLMYTRVPLVEGESGNPSVEVVVYDFGAQRVVSVFPIAGMARLGHTELLVADEGSIAAYSLNGISRPIYAPPDGRGIVGFDVSPGGGLLAVAEQTQASWLRIIEIATGGVIVEVRREPGPIPDDWYFWRPFWRDDGVGSLVLGGTGSERPGRIATVLLDGTVRAESAEGYQWTPPNGRYALDGAGSLGCMFISTHSFAVIDLDSEEVLASVTDDERALTPAEWSPDSRYLVVAARRLPVDWEPTGNVDAPSCDWTAEEPALLVLDTETGDVTSTDMTLEELRAAWRPGEIVPQFRCDGGTIRSGVSRFTNLLESGRCIIRPVDTVYGPVRLVVGGDTIDAAASFTILGTIEVP